MSTNERLSAEAIRVALAECMTLADVDEAMGWAAGTAAKSRRRPHGLPEPDAWLGRTPVYFRTTFERWRASRPGQGTGGGRPSHKRGEPRPGRACSHPDARDHECVRPIGCLCAGGVL